MNFFLCGILVRLLISEIEVCQAILCKEASLSFPVINHNHRRLKGFTFKTFYLASLVSCGLLCQRDPRCVSTNFRNVHKWGERRGGLMVSALDSGSGGPGSSPGRGHCVVFLGKTKLEYGEEAIYTQFYNTKVTQKKKKMLLIPRDTCLSFVVSFS